MRLTNVFFRFALPLTLSGGGMLYGSNWGGNYTFPYSSDMPVHYSYNAGSSNPENYTQSDPDVIQKVESNIEDLKDIITRDGADSFAFKSLYVSITHTILTCPVIDGDDFSRLFDKVNTTAGFDTSRLFMLLGPSLENLRAQCNSVYPGAKDPNQANIEAKDDSATLIQDCIIEKVDSFNWSQTMGLALASIVLIGSTLHRKPAIVPPDNHTESRPSPQTL